MIFQSEELILELAKWLHPKDFEALLRVSKNHKKVLAHLVPLRRPYFHIYCSSYGGGSDANMNPKALIHRNDDEETYQLLLRLGSCACKTRFYYPKIRVFPYLFRQVIDNQEHDGLENPVLDLDRYVTQVLQNFSMQYSTDADCRTALQHLKDLAETSVDYYLNYFKDLQKRVDEQLNRMPPAEVELNPDSQYGHITDIIDFMYVTNP